MVSLKALKKDINKQFEPFEEEISQRKSRLSSQKQLLSERRKELVSARKEAQGIRVPQRTIANQFSLGQSAFQIERRVPKVKSLRREALSEIDKEGQRLKSQEQAIISEEQRLSEASMSLEKQRRKAIKKARFNILTPVKRQTDIIISPQELSFTPKKSFVSNITSSSSNVGTIGKIRNFLQGETQKEFELRRQKEIISNIPAKDLELIGGFSTKEGTVEFRQATKEQIKSAKKISQQEFASLPIRERVKLESRDILVSVAKGGKSAIEFFPKALSGGTISKNKKEIDIAPSLTARETKLSSKLLVAAPFVFRSGKDFSNIKKGSFKEGIGNVAGSFSIARPKPGVFVQTPTNIRGQEGRQLNIDLQRNNRISDIASLQQKEVSSGLRIDAPFERRLQFARGTGIRNDKVTAVSGKTQTSTVGVEITPSGKIKEIPNIIIQQPFVTTGRSFNVGKPTEEFSSFRSTTIRPGDTTSRNLGIIRTKKGKEFDIFKGVTGTSKLSREPISGIIVKPPKGSSVGTKITKGSVKSNTPKTSSTTTEQKLDEAVSNIAFPTNLGSVPKTVVRTETRSLPTIVGGTGARGRFTGLGTFERTEQVIAKNNNLPISNLRDETTTQVVPKQRNIVSSATKLSERTVLVSPSVSVVSNTPAFKQKIITGQKFLQRTITPQTQTFPLTNTTPNKILIGTPFKGGIGAFPKPNIKIPMLKGDSFGRGGKGKQPTKFVPSLTGNVRFNVLGETITTKKAKSIRGLPVIRGVVNNKKRKKSVI